MRRTIKILDIQVPASLIVQSEVAKKANMCPANLHYYLIGKYKSEEPLRRIRKAIIELYTNVITYVPDNSKYNDTKGKKILKKTA